MPSEKACEGGHVIDTAAAVVLLGLGWLDVSCLDYIIHRVMPNESELDIDPTGDCPKNQLFLVGLC